MLYWYLKVICSFYYHNVILIFEGYLLILLSQFYTDIWRLFTHSITMLYWYLKVICSFYYHNVILIFEGYLLILLSQFYTDIWGLFIYFHIWRFYRYLGFIYLFIYKLSYTWTVVDYFIDIWDLFAHSVASGLYIAILYRYLGFIFFFTLFCTWNLMTILYRYLGLVFSFCSTCTVYDNVLLAVSVL